MVDILFSKSAILYYFIILLIEFTTRYGIYETEIKGESHFLPFADFCGLCAFSFLIYFSFTTVWWAFMGLIAINVLCYKILRLLLKYSFYNKALKLSTHFRFVLIPLIILMFALVKK